jgi:3',5'-cyclic AMP phosphodiesterase CpdA
MNRKIFLRSVAIGSLPVFFPLSNYAFERSSNRGNIQQEEWLMVQHSFDDFNAEIKCKEIKEGIKLVHISDTHISVLPNGKSEFPEFTGRMDSAYKNPKHYLTGAEGTKENHFENILREAKEKNAELLVLTGDIINNPTIANVDFIKTKLDEYGIPYIYTSGNHDWHFEGMQGKQQELHTEWVTKRLNPLYNGDNPFYSSHVIKDINFVAIDNSTYQVTNEQVEFFREQTRKTFPIVLCMHIPVYQPIAMQNKHVVTMADPRWNAQNDNGYEVERRERWSENGNQRSTCEFLIEILSCQKLLAVLAGHVHKAMQNQISVSAYQYLTQASLSGAYRTVELRS